METIWGTDAEGLTLWKLRTTGTEPSFPIASAPGWNTTTQLWVIFGTIEGVYIYICIHIFFLRDTDWWNCGLHKDQYTSWQFTRRHGQNLRTCWWFTIQQSQGLFTNGWFKEIQCVVLHNYIIHQNKQSRIIQQSMIFLNLMWCCDWCTMCGAGRRWKENPPW